jgi:hypothetical protein
MQTSQYLHICRCVPVVFFEASRSLVWWIPPDEADSVSVKLPLATLLEPRGLAKALRAREKDLPAMQAKLAQVCICYAMHVSVSSSNVKLHCICVLGCCP